MSETTNENLQGAEKAQVIQLQGNSETQTGYTEMTPTEESISPTGEELVSVIEPKLIGTKIITIKTDIYDNDQQNISINTPEGSSMAENLGMLDICRHILLKDKF